DVRSLICGPLYAGEELIGLLYVDNPVTRQFSEADLELFSAIANYAAVAITQGRLAERLREESERRERLQRYHSPAVVERIMAQRQGEGADVLPAQGRDIRVLFADLVGFTSLWETVTPADVAALLNRFFSEMTEAIFAERGPLTSSSVTRSSRCSARPWNRPITRVERCAQRRRCGERWRG